MSNYAFFSSTISPPAAAGSAAFGQRQHVDKLIRQLQSSSSWTWKNNFPVPYSSHNHHNRARTHIMGLLRAIRILSSAVIAYHHQLLGLSPLFSCSRNHLPLHIACALAFSWLINWRLSSYCVWSSCSASQSSLVTWDLLYNSCFAGHFNSGKIPSQGNTFWSVYLLTDYVHYVAHGLVPLSLSIQFTDSTAKVQSL